MTEGDPAGSEPWWHEGFSHDRPFWDFPPSSVALRLTSNAFGSVWNRVERMKHGTGLSDWSVDPRTAYGALSSYEAVDSLRSAVHSVMGLQYLAALDRHLQPGRGRRKVLGYPAWAVDMAHLHWATISAITALDLCAATLGRLHCRTGDSGRDLTVRTTRRRPEIQRIPGAIRWLDAVDADGRYRYLLKLRNRLTHQTELFTEVGAIHDDRIHVVLPGIRPGMGGGGVATTSAGGIVVLARDVALTHVTAFVEAAARSELTPASSLPPDGG
ncbi:MAG: hypothetical protein JO286_04475 [Solirubrobacterales bacterium]|nr:hypothetical protein [Solirubrobacterales bacterium]MBV9806415.1 hypothetical protein [Solirubrobacterales bacterium]